MSSGGRRELVVWCVSDILNPTTATTTTTTVPGG